MPLWLVIHEAAFTVTATRESTAESYAREDAGDFMAANDYTLSEAFEVSADAYSVDDEIRISASVSPEEGEDEPDDDDEDPDDITWNATASLEVVVEAATEAEAVAKALARLKEGEDA